jgi:CheY-like chemotaxis protein
VDDEPMVARSLRRMLANHEVVVAVGGREARELLEGDPAFDVVFCDLMMPDLCGPDLFEQVRERHPALERRFVFMTGGAFTSRTASFLDQVPNQRIEKPFELSKIQQALAECLGTASGAAQ